MRYAGDQNCEKAQFCSHFMPLQGRSNILPAGSGREKKKLFRTHETKETRETINAEY
jgi:hypothetical protein